MFHLKIQPEADQGFLYGKAVGETTEKMYVRGLKVSLGNTLVAKGNAVGASTFHRFYPSGKSAIFASYTLQLFIPPNRL